MMHNHLIGAIHFPPLPGYDGYPGFDTAVAYALADLEAFQKGGCSAVIIENNYDVPHVERVSQAVRDEMIALGNVLVAHATVPVGVSVLWNDYESAFAIAVAIGASFIRVPVFVDRVQTAYGIMEPQANRVHDVQQKCGATHVAIYADIHVKHATILSGTSIAEAATAAVAAGADALIVTGQWTGDAPLLGDLTSVRAAVGATVPILCGSGVATDNVRSLMAVANGAIVSTSVKEDSAETHHENVKPYTVRVSEQKVRALVQTLT